MPDGTEMVMPGDNVQMVVDLIAPIAMEDGLRFAIREAVEPSVQVSSPKLLSKNHRGIAGVRGADESNVMKER